MTPVSNDHFVSDGWLATAPRKGFNPSKDGLLGSGVYVTTDLGHWVVAVKERR